MVCPRAAAICSSSRVRAGSDGPKVTTSATRDPMFNAASNAASLGRITGIDRSALTASIAGPKAEQVNSTARVS